MAKRKAIYSKEFYIILTGVTVLTLAKEFGVMANYVIDSSDFPNKKLVGLSVVLTFVAISLLCMVAIAIHDFIVEVAPKFVGDSDE